LRNAPARSAIDRGHDSILLLCSSIVPCECRGCDFVLALCTFGCSLTRFIIPSKLAESRMLWACIWVRISAKTYIVTVFFFFFSFPQPLQENAGKMCKIQALSLCFCFPLDLYLGLNLSRDKHHDRVFCSFPQPLQENAWKMRKIRPLPLCF
jgi:hypothetical protein